MTDTGTGSNPCPVKIPSPWQRTEDKILRMIGAINPPNTALAMNEPKMSPYAGSP